MKLAVIAVVLALSSRARADTTAGFLELLPPPMGGDRLVTTGATQYAETVIGFGDLPPSIEAAAYRWVPYDSAEVELLSPLATRSYARAISFDGALVVGQSAFDQELLAVVWDRAGAQALPSLFAGGECDALGVSAYGGIIVGTCAADVTGRRVAVLWLRVGALWEVEPLGGEGTVARAISGDSTVIAGATAGRAAIWRLGGAGYQLTELPPVPEGFTAGGTSDALAVSADGSTVVGTSRLDGSAATIAWRWTAATGRMEWLGTLTGRDPAVAEVLDEVGAVSKDGALVVGRSGSAADGKAFVWSAASGMLDLQALLSGDSGLADRLGGWVLSRVSYVSPDGDRLVGDGTRDGEARGWSIVFDASLLETYVPPADETPEEATEAAPETPAEETPEAASHDTSEGAGEATPEASEEPSEAAAETDGEGLETGPRGGGDGGCGAADRGGASGLALAIAVLLWAGRRRARAARWTPIAVVLALSSHAHADTGSFIELMPLPTGGDRLVTTGASQSTATVVGFGDLPPSVEAAAYRWVDEQPLQLEGLSPSAARSYARAVSGDGALIVGQSAVGDEMLAVVWDEAGAHALPSLFAGGDCDALGVSAYGGIVVGVCEATGAHVAVWWLRVGADWEVEPLGDEGTVARAISGDSTVIAGATADRAAVWRLGSAGYRLAELPAVPEGFAAGTSEAFAVSADGSTVVGTSTLDGSASQVVWRWTAATGRMEWLGTLSGLDPAVAGVADEVAAVSADGALVVGRSGAASDRKAFVWSAASGMLDLQAYLGSDFGMAEELAGWDLSRVSWISANGHRLAGDGTRYGKARVWVAAFEGPILEVYVPPVDETPEEASEEAPAGEEGPEATTDDTPEAPAEATPETSGEAAPEAAGEEPTGDAAPDADEAVETSPPGGGDGGCGAGSQGGALALAFLTLLWGVVRTRHARACSGAHRASTRAQDGSGPSSPARGSGCWPKRRKPCS